MAQESNEKVELTEDKSTEENVELIEEKVELTEDKSAEEKPEE